MALLSGQRKLYLLLACLCASLGTFFTSYSFQMGSRDLPMLKPSADNNYCNAHSLTNTNSRCQLAVEHAYRKINLGGCLVENQANILCKMEWCHPGGDSDERRACQKECKDTRRKVSDCVDRHVRNSLKKYGFDKDSVRY